MSKLEKIGMTALFAVILNGVACQIAIGLGNPSELWVAISVISIALAAFLGTIALVRKMMIDMWKNW